MVEATGFEPAASCSQSKHSTKLSYASDNSCTVLDSFYIIPDEREIVKAFLQFCIISQILRKSIAKLQQNVCCRQKEKGHRCPLSDNYSSSSEISSSASSSTTSTASSAALSASASSSSSERAKFISSSVS